ncbi:rhomboid family intramembrane serine protease [Rhodobacterales bacterium HKCCE3408]|nr:rhomboid family intramembrane serine protease [Rhodobacterales bacterium HKCCE3408]
MTDARPPRADRPFPKLGPWARTMILGLIAISTLIELGLWGSDLGLWGPPRLRQTVYEWAGFWPGLLHGWTPNFPGQPVAMFLTYGFLHGGPVHLLVNMVTLWSLGGAVAARIKARGLLALYLGSVLGGAAGYGLLAQTVQPMVGASGGLFGLAGGLLAWAYIDRYSLRARLWPVARVALLLVAMNVAMYWALDGQLAWQTHLGGFLTGWILAILLDPMPRRTLVRRG